MKSRNRSIAFMMTLVFVFTSVLSFSATLAGAASFTDVAETSAYYEAINSLVGNGVINGYEDGTFKPDNTITRAEFSKLLATSSAPSGTAFTATTTKFPDVADSTSPSAWAIPYISYAVGIKAINGYEDGTFRPTNTVTYGEAVKMIVCTLGYEPVIDKTLTPWYQGYIDVANQIKLTTNAVALGDAPAPRGLVAQLIFNMLSCKPLVQTGVDMFGNPIYSAGGDDGFGAGSFDEQKDNATEEEGVLLGLIDYTLTGRAIKRTQVQIDNDVYDMGKLDAEILKELIGRTVSFKYNAKDVITSLKEAPGYNDEIVVNAPQIEDVTSSYLTYYKNETAELDGKVTRINFSNLKVIYNGVPVHPSDIGAGFNLASYLDVEDGSITFISNDGDKSSAEVAVVKSYRTYFANTPSTSNGITTVYDQYPAVSGQASALTIDPDEVALIKKITSKGGKAADAKPTDIRKGHVVSVAYPYPFTPSDNALNAEIIISTASVTGQVTEMDSDYSYIKIGSAEYEVAPYFERALMGGLEVAFTVNDSGKFYLDRLGRIAFFEKNQSTNPYALAVRFKATTGFNALYGLDLYISGNAGTKFFPLKDQVKVNGSTKDAAEVIDFLKNSCPTYAQNASIGGGAYIIQPIRYATTKNSTTGEAEISSIECMDPGNNYQDGAIVPYAFENTANSDGAELFANGGKLTYSKSGYAFKNGTATQFSVGSSSVIFKIPQNIEEVELYRKITYTGFGEGNFVVEPYDVEKGTAKLALYYPTAGQSSVNITARTPAYLIESISDTQDPNRNAVKKIKYYEAGKGELKEVLTDADSNIPELSTLGSGDVIKFALTEGAVSVIKKVYDYNPSTLFTDTGDIVDGKPNHIALAYDGVQGYYQAIVGTVYTIDENVVNIIPLEAESDGSFTEENIGRREGFTLDASAVYYKYEADKGKFRIMDTSGEIKQYAEWAEMNPSEASKVLAIVMNKKVVAVYILN